MKIDEYIIKVNKVLTDVVVNKLTSFFVERVTMDIVQSVQQRLQDEGTLASGEKPSYSTKPALVGYPSDDMKSNYKTLYKSAYESLKKDKNNKWITYKGHKLVEASGGYKQIRELGGYQTGHVDFTISGSMLRAVKVIKKTTTNNKITVYYGVTQKEEIAKVQGHSDRYNENILAPNEAEIEKLKETLQKQIIRYINEGL